MRLVLWEKKIDSMKELGMDTTLDGLEMLVDMKRINDMAKIIQVGEPTMAKSRPQTKQDCIIRVTV